MKTFKLKTLIIACAATIMIGCGDSETKVTALESTPADSHDGHDHGHEGELGEGRLAIADADQALVHIFSLEDNTLVESVTVTQPATYLYASPESRYAIAVNDSINNVEFIDGGLWQELHGDHYDQHNDSPVLTSFNLSDVKPANYSASGKKSALFFNGDKEIAANANLAILSDESISEGKLIAEYHYDTYVDGTAEIRGDYVLAALRDTSSENTLPEHVALFEIHDDHLHKEKEFETNCPGLQGSFQTEEYIAFSCSDGILAIKQQDNTFTENKVNYSTAVAEGVKITSLQGSEESNVMIGKASSGMDFFLVDVENQSVTAFNWQQKDNLTSVAYGFDGHHEHMLILDNEGHLNLYAAEDNWAFENKIDVFETLDANAMPLIVPSKAHEVIYIINEEEVTTVDLHEGKVTGHFDLTFTPGNAVWLGVASEEEHDHEGEEEHDHADEEEHDHADEATH